MRLRLLHAPRCTDTPDEYEDALWPEAVPAPLTLPLRLAVADGATTSSFSGLWARTLVRAWGEERIHRASLTGDVAALAKDWRAAVDGLELPWFAREKARQGAHAALLGLLVEPTGDLFALAIGDCCLFQVRDETLIEAFPARHPEALNTHPYLVGTQADPQLNEAVRTLIGRWQEGDTLFLMSDALARWFLESAVVHEQRPWQWLESLGSAKALQTALPTLQKNSLLARDDVTLVVLNL